MNNRFYFIFKNNSKIYEHQDTHRTGNTYWVAKSISEQIDDCELVNIAKYDDYKNKIQAKRVGIFYPVYYWRLPNLIKNFINKISIETPYLYEVHTMGGYDGIATLQLRKYLNEKELKLSASYRIKMPNNIALINKSNLLTDVYQIPSDKKIRKLIHKAEKKIIIFSNMIINAKVHSNFEPFYVKPWHKFGFALNEKQTSYFYQKGEEFGCRLENTCNGCGKCSNVCPVSNIQIIAGKPVWGLKCEFCTACLHACPVRAINYGYSKGKVRYQFPK